jgi:hypothetical protein
MPKSYEPIDDNHKLREVLNQVIVSYHRILLDSDVTIALLTVRNFDANGEQVDPALTHGGYPAMATIKINSYRDRVEGKADVTITVDGQRWDELSDAELAAVLDHELTHLELVLEEDGSVSRDDIDRPKLRMRRHDFQIGGFNEVAKRHKADSLEVQAVAKVGKGFVEQGVFPGF